MKGTKIHWDKTGLNQAVFVKAISKLPFEISESFTKFYEVEWYGGGTVMYLAKGGFVKNEVCVYYRSGKFYPGYGKNFAEAIKNAANDAIYYA